MQQQYKILLVKDDIFFEITLPKNTKCKILNSNKIKKSQQLKIGDTFSENYRIYQIQKVNNSEKIKIKNNIVQITNTIKDFCKEVDLIFKDDLWDIKNKKFLQLCNVYNITAIYNIFAGLQIENSFGDTFYYTGAASTDDFYQKIENANFEKIKQIKLI